MVWIKNRTKTLILTDNKKIIIYFSTRFKCINNDNYMILGVYFCCPSSLLLNYKCKALPCQFLLAFCPKNYFYVFVQSYLRPDPGNGSIRSHYMYIYWRYGSIILLFRPEDIRPAGNHHTHVQSAVMDKFFLSGIKLMIPCPVHKVPIY